MSNRMVYAVVTVGLAVLAGGCAADYAPAKQSAQKRFDFEQVAPGQAPADFVAARTGGGTDGVWVIREDRTSPAGRLVLVQTSADRTSQRYPLFIYQGLSAADVTVSVRFKPISGEVDQAAGLMVRFRDKDNYYLVRANALEDNLRFYKVENGQRKQLATVQVKPVAAQQWHTLELSAKGTHFRVSVNGQQLLEAEDATFTTAGLAGLWTKADSVTEFDDLRITRNE